MGVLNYKINGGLLFRVETYIIIIATGGDGAYEDDVS